MKMNIDLIRLTVLMTAILAPLSSIAATGADSSGRRAANRQALMATRDPALDLQTTVDLPDGASVWDLFAAARFSSSLRVRIVSPELRGEVLPTTRYENRTLMAILLDVAEEADLAYSVGADPETGARILVVRRGNNRQR